MGLLQPDVGHGGRDRRARLSRIPKAVTVHCLDHAAAAVAAAAETGQAVLLLSAPSAAGYVGPAWFAATVEAARQASPNTEILPVLDCGDQAGHALAALRHGLLSIRYHGPASERIRALAERHGAALLDARPESLDLAELDTERPGAWRTACLRWLSPET